ncbi:DJ-1/PfpI family protein [Streptosporangiaceae bacterium NEAU-GS5]|nr:DJ-1/PfpI family protein [Streptosporangiaceae bacterium NEAU-GS5]
MRIAILLFERMTALDAVGPYEVLSRIPDAEITFVGERTGPVRTDTRHLGLVVDARLDELTDPDILVIPGGPGQTAHMDDGPLHDWIRAADAVTRWTTSVCTGSLILAATGLLKDRRATSHWLALEQLPRYGVTPSPERVVVDGKYVTGAGVSAGIDMALTLTGQMSGDFVAQAIQLGIEYDPQPPYDAGSPRKAPDEVSGFLRSQSRFILQGE